jgi:predicted dehydrogenase
VTDDLRQKRQPSTPQRELRAAVVGAGHLGALHAQKYAALPGVRLTLVVDPDSERARAVAAATSATPIADYQELAGRVDLASVAAPGSLHHPIAAGLMTAGIDVLVEKPMAATLAEARELRAVAVRTGRILQVGHLERFNPAVVRLRSIVSKPRFIECHRLAPFTERGTDVDVVLDLMVHDLDVILSVAPVSEVVALEAVGVPVLTDQIDVANARIRFGGGLIANLNTSRVAPRRERKIRFFQPDAYISVDYEARRIQVYRKSPPPPGSTFPMISADQIDLGDADPLMDEIVAFATSVRTRAAPPVTADDGLRVMELSERIRTAMETEAAAGGLDLPPRATRS